jgi:hypothetical protein
MIIFYVKIEDIQQIVNMTKGPQKTKNRVNIV